MSKYTKRVVCENCGREVWICEIELGGCWYCLPSTDGTIEQEFEWLFAHIADPVVRGHLHRIKNILRGMHPHSAGAG